MNENIYLYIYISGIYINY